MSYRRTNRLVRWPAILLAVALAIGGLALAGAGRAGAGGGADKVIVCHATASETNPWVRIEVSENSLPAHLGDVGNSHSHQHSLGRYDFVWTSDYDEQCLRVPNPDPIGVECSGHDSVPDPLVAVADNDDRTSVPCPGVHSWVTLPVGVHMIECARGTATLPHTVTYQLHPGGVFYVVNCLAGDIVDLGIQGGPVQVVCPAEGVVSLYGHTLFGPMTVTSACPAGELVPNATTAVGPHTTAIEWTNSRSITGLIRCPAPGVLELFFLGEGSPSTDANAATAFPCTPGAAVDVTRLVL